MKFIKALFLSLVLLQICRADDSIDLGGKLADVAGAQAGMSQAFSVGMKPALQQMKAQGMPDELIAQINDEAQKFFADNFKWEEVRPELAKLYASNFTEAELKDLLTFYSSPTGKKAAASLPTLMQQGAAFGMSRVQAKMPEFQQKVMALVQDYRMKHMPPAAAAPADASATPAAPSPAK